MAAAFDPTELKNLLECGICLNRFQEPRVLPCLHSYCLECLESHISSSKDQDGAFNCPQCREKCFLPDEGADKFPKNFFVNTMKDVLPESILQEPSQEAAESSGPIVCKHHDQENGDEHGEAVTFCVQCDAHFCQLCTKNHGLFIKDHKVTPVGDTRGTATELSANCKLHQSIPINWYCQSCSLPVCAECLAEKHKDHNSDKLLNVEAALKLDMLDVSKMAAKRVKVLQNISSSIKADETKMERDLDKVSKDISDTADSLCKLIRQHENTLQDQLKQAREKAKKQFKKVEDELQTATDNTMTLKAKAQSLHQASSEQALCTVSRAQVTKQQYLHQQDLPVSSTKWILEKQSSQLRKLEESTFLGSIDCNIFVESQKSVQVENVSLESPLHIAKLEYKGKHAICSISPIYSSMICVAHFYEQEIWVYSDDGGLQQKVNIPGITSISGMITLGKEKGKLAIIDNKQSKVYFVSLSPHDLTIQKKSYREIPIVPHVISVNHNGELVLAPKEYGRIIVISIDGEIISDITVPMPHDSPAIFGIQQTKFGFVICDKRNKRVYLTDSKGHILQTSTAYTQPWQVLRISWGHILVVDTDSKAINVLGSETDEFLGRVHDETDAVFLLHCTYVNEADRVLYVGCRTVGSFEVRTYKLAPGDLPLLPVPQNMSDVRVNVTMIKL